MGNTSYNYSSRSLRASVSGYATKSVDQLFTQNIKRSIHESMNPRGITIRESRDSETNPNTTPIIFALDVTGSMRKVPHYLIKEGLPKMVSKMIQLGIPNPQILFLAIGDGITDIAPLQVGQFESGDEELDMWLTRTFLEGGGGANNGESYNLAWYFAGTKTAIDSLEKRGKKGFLFTIGDEPCLEGISSRMLEGITGETVQSTLSNQELLNMAKEKYNVFHLQVLEGQKGHQSLPFWQELLGQNCIEIKDQREIADVIADTIYNNLQDHNFVSREVTIENPNTIDGIDLTSVNVML